jgi:adenylyltransferase/sulfurtransferase
MDGVRMTPAQLKQRLDTGEAMELIDVREPFEWSISNLEPLGARLIPMGELAERLGELDPAADIVFYCRSGSRSERVAEYLRAHGFERVWSLDGGINAWAQEIDPALPMY